MTTADPVLASRPTIDPVRWPDLAASRAKVRRGVESAVALSWPSFSIAMYSCVPAKEELTAW